jgi:hypothetical protein
MYTNQELNAIHNSKIGFEFEFFANHDIVKAKDDLSRILNKKIRIEDKAHSDFSPTSDVFKLEPDNSGGSGMIELVTGSVPFPEAKLILAKTLKWIRENGSTNDRCSIHINLSFNTETLGPNVNMSRLDIGKFVLSFDEDKVYDEFPKRKGSVYAKSIKFAVPLSGMTGDNPGKTTWTNYQFVNDKYYGVNFTKVPKGYIEFRYLGGEGYEKMYNSILRLSEHFILSLYNVLTNPKYTKDDKKELDRILDIHKDVIYAYKSYAKFKEAFPNIKILIDLKTADNIIEMYYVKIRDVIFNLLTKAELRDGLINYDSDTGKIQVKDADLTHSYDIHGIDLVNCKVNGNIKQCDIFDCEIEGASLFECNAFGYTTIKSCKIEDCYISRNVEVIDCYVFGPRGVFSGEMKGGIFRKGKATQHARFGKSTEVIEVEKIK